MTLPYLKIHISDFTFDNIIIIMYEKYKIIQYHKF